MNYDLEEIKRLNDIREVARDLGLEVKGNNARCWQTWNHKHNDRHPSIVFTSHNTFYCSVCPDLKGDVIKLVELHEELSFIDAVEKLAKRQGIPLRAENKPIPIVSVSSDEKKEGDKSNIIRQKFLDISLPIRGYGLDYLLRRGFRLDTLRDLKVGFIEAYEEAAYPLLKEYGKDTLRLAGITAFYRYRDLPFILIPYLKGTEVVYFKGRNLLPKDDNNKIPYLNTGGTVPIPYNFNCLDKTDRVFITESELKAISLIQRGYNAIGIFGTGGFKEEWLGYFKGKEVYLIMDNDDPGRKTVESIGKLFIKNNKQITKAIYLDKDLDEWFLEREGIYGRERIKSEARL